MANTRIILADDHPFVLLGVRSALDAHVGVSVVGEAITPTLLIELLRSTPCDVLVTDLSMPEPSGAVEDGLSLVRRIRDEWPLLRIVVMTMLTNAAILRAVVSDGAVSALSKTESMDQLWQAIEASRSGGTYLGRSINEALAESWKEEQEPPPVARLSRLQAEVVKLFVSGQSISEIAAALGCHRRTVSRQKREAMVKLGVTNGPGLFSYVRAHGIPSFESHI
ncbi:MULTISPECIES: response regulator transcription factor [Paraburkholderia]|jgi:two-component system capsular synthesis response regulator RcsB|uniref:Two component transcriptional regulator, LuxR family n=1 Tax=Paraburkholderia terricola TaxID=169427 RepID=A0A1M6Y9T6_9BURK|nr:MULTISPECIES: response regulator transcription factor [Paraburkholderia]SDP35123.1 two component transcriptional regulator, LuxR family [Paraburkholderia sediminicola]SHL14913.1 two component transcriptional regulator, LuxR family [Paraburkholderia terricola]